MKFNKWLDTFVQEKNLDTEHVFEVDGAVYGANHIPLGCVIDQMKATTPHEQNAIKNMVVRIDFKNGDVMDYFEHLAGAMAV